MLKLPQPFIQLQSSEDFKSNFFKIQQLLTDLLDTPVKDVYHIGGTKQTNYTTEPIVDVLVTVKSLHDITSLDEKRLNYHQIYRLHHAYKKKVIMAQFEDMITLKQIARLHIVEQNSQMIYDYLTVEELLTNHKPTINAFQSFKINALQASNTIREYENHKQQWFEQLIRNQK
nr:GrpB family protein [Mammaliicoccus sp. Marseille-Q6498]